MDEDVLGEQGKQQTLAEEGREEEEGQKSVGLCVCVCVCAYAIEKYQECKQLILRCGVRSSRREFGSQCTAVDWVVKTLQRERFVMACTAQSRTAAQSRAASKLQAIPGCCNRADVGNLNYL